MIQPLRRTHRLTFMVMGCALALVLFAGLAARRREAARSGVSSALPGSAYLIQRSSRLWQRHTIVSEFYGDSGDMQRFYIVLRPQHPLNRPDPLVYWSSSAVDNGTLPPGARLVGALESGRFLSLQTDGERSGRLILYSGADRQIIDATLVEKLP